MIRRSVFKYQLTFLYICINWKGNKKKISFTIAKRKEKKETKVRYLGVNLICSRPA